ncbi:hypothetical protein [Microvirga subterranea]|uniref:Uncharacterized protein n=1 Tax=Microvirga subterranea TaxID=186651 RepID=A0A370HGE7_9HYPH|nr:hypothetical protein [Microvirga subterranea]RDI56321.1 hypothetical protein DES45_1095 [Microvirga subterranea]
MPVFDASVLNDNDEAMAFLRSVLAPPEGRPARPVREMSDMRRIRPAERHRIGRSTSRVPLIVGVAVSIMTARV